MTILTPKELKYLFLKLDTILSEDKKQQIIELGGQKRSRVVWMCVGHFLARTGSEDHKGLKAEVTEIVREEQSEL